MPIPFECPCGNQLNAPERLAGGPADCPASGRTLTVPGGGERRDSDGGERRAKSGEPQERKKPPHPDFAPSSYDDPEPEQIDNDDDEPGEIYRLSRPAPSDAPSSSTQQPTRRSRRTPAKDVADVPDAGNGRTRRQSNGDSPGRPAPGKNVFIPNSPQDDDSKKAGSDAAPRRRKKRKRKAESVRRPTPRKKRKRPRSLFAAWADSFVHPFRGDGKWTLATWTALYLGMQLISAAAGFLRILLLIVFIPALLIFTGYFFWYLLQVLRAAAQGEDELPSSNHDNGYEMVPDLLKWAVCMFVGFFPLMFYSTAALASGVDRLPVLTWLCIGFAIFYTPMALLSTALFDALLGVNPLTVVQAIFRIPLEYLPTCVLISVVVVSYSWFELHIAPKVPIIGPTIGFFALMYATIVAMHMLGTVYFRNRRKIDWLR